MSSETNNWSFALKVLSLAGVIGIGFLSNEPEPKVKAENLLEVNETEVKSIEDNNPFEKEQSLPKQS